MVFGEASRAAERRCNVYGPWPGQAGARLACSNGDFRAEASRALPFTILRDAFILQEGRACAYGV